MDFSTNKRVCDLVLMYLDMSGREPFCWYLWTEFILATEWNRVFGGCGFCLVSIMGVVLRLMRCCKSEIDCVLFDRLFWNSGLIMVLLSLEML